MHYFWRVVQAKETQEKKHEKTYVIGAYATSTNKDGASLDCIAFITVNRDTQTVEDLDYVDVAYALNGKIKGSRSKSLGSGLSPTSSASSEINISDFLDVVKEMDPSIFC